MISVDEDVASNHALFSASASDPDTGVNGKIRYSLLKDADGLLEIDPDSGVVRISSRAPLKSHLNEVFNNDDPLEGGKRKLEVVVGASDGGSPPLTGELRMQLLVRDVNDHAPKFRQEVVDVFLSEAEAVNHRFHCLEAEDEDEGENGKVAFSLLAEGEHFLDEEKRKSETDALWHSDSENLENQTKIFHCPTSSEASE